MQEVIVKNGKDDTIEEVIKEDISEDEEENRHFDETDITPKWVKELPHEFEETKFFKITSCEFSRTVFPPFVSGLRCRYCSYDIKKKFQDQALKNCNHNYDERIQVEEYEKLHDFYPKHFSSTSFCNVCRKLLVGLNKQGYSCQVCGYASHKECMVNAPHSCPPLSFKTRLAKNHRHFWIEGNMKGSCHTCKRSLETKSVLYGYRCFYCQHQSCPECMNEDKYHSVCDLGSLANIKLHPTNLISPSDDKSTWEVTFHEDCIPLFVFINKRSGGQVGEWIIRRFNKLLNPIQVVDLRNGEPNHTFHLLSRTNRPYKVLACGGDGTAAWILSVIDKMKEEYPNSFIPPVAVLPLGTGNDLSRTLGWGGGYDKEPIDRIIECVIKGNDILLDRWLIKITTENDEVSEMILNNYFSIGIDAKIALDFHNAREKNPSRFKSRTINKMYYAHYGAVSMIGGTSTMHKRVKLIVDDLEIDLPKNLEGIMLLNLPSWAGGKNPWGKHSLDWAPQSINDGILEVCGLKGSWHMGRIQANLTEGIKIAQGSKIVFEWIEDEELPCQLDGEPFLKGKCKIEIVHYTQSKMVMNLDHHLLLEEDDEDEEIESDE